MLGFRNILALVFILGGFAVFGAIVDMSSDAAAHSALLDAGQQPRLLSNEDLDVDGSGSGVDVIVEIPHPSTPTQFARALTFQSSLWQGDLEFVKWFLFGAIATAVALTKAERIVDGIFSIFRR